jgi:hypothetical protein
LRSSKGPFSGTGVTTLWPQMAALLALAEEVAKPEMAYAEIF